VLSRKTEEKSGKATAYVTLAVGLLTAGVVIYVSTLTDISKAIGALALAFAGYALYNELDKYFSKSRVK
jgi:hypothetical protein